jgi:hypothetical protein
MPAISRQRVFWQAKSCARRVSFRSLTKSGSHQEKRAFFGLYGFTGATASRPLSMALCNAAAVFSIWAAYQSMGFWVPLRSSSTMRRNSVQSAFHKSLPWRRGIWSGLSFKFALIKWWSDMCILSSTVQSVINVAKAGDATIISMHVAAFLVWNVGSDPSFSTQRPNWKSISLTLVPQGLTELDPHTLLCAFESIPAR